MSPSQMVKQVLRLQEKAERHQSEYERLLGVRSAKAKALSHLYRAEQLRSQISSTIREFASVQA